MYGCKGKTKYDEHIFNPTYKTRRLHYVPRKVQQHIGLRASFVSRKLIKLKLVTHYFPRYEILLVQEVKLNLPRYGHSPVSKYRYTSALMIHCHI